MIQQIKHAPDGGVHGGYGGDVFQSPSRTVRNFEQFLSVLAEFTLGKPGLGLEVRILFLGRLRPLRTSPNGGIQIGGIVRGVERQIEEKRFLMMRLEKPNRFALKQISTVGALVGLGGRIIPIHRRHAVAFVGVVINSGIHEPIKIIEPARQRQEPLMHAKIPFAENAADIAGRFQQRRQQHLARVHAANPLEGRLVFAGLVLVPVVRCLVADHVVNAVALRVTPSEQRAARGRASRPGDIKLRKLRSVFGQAIELGRENFIGPKAAEIAVALIIGHDQHNVGWRGQKAERKQQRQQ